MKREEILTRILLYYKRLRKFQVFQKQVLREQNRIMQELMDDLAEYFGVTGSNRDNE